MAPALSPSLIRLDTIPSTNTWLALQGNIDALPHGTLVSARTQSAGRGQRGNTWEAEPGKNITMSILLRPAAVVPARQFVISEVVSVAVALLLRRHVPAPHRVAVKWPNDIYVDDRKICGILIEHTLTGGAIDHTIAGIGININQLRFVSDAPNPASLRQYTGREHDVEELVERLGGDILGLMARYDNPDLFSELHDIYLSMLWRRDTEATYIDTATGEPFRATLQGVAPDGHLLLQPADGSPLRSYAFKEVMFVL